MSNIDASKSELAHSSVPVTSKSGILLIPKPTDDPQDPLNWSTGKKIRILAILSWAAYAGNASALSGQLAYPTQASVYNRTSLELSYSVSAAISGLAVGALLLAPFAKIVGRSSVTFWSLLGCLACAIWSAEMTGEDDYIKFVISRLLSGIFASVPSAVGGGTIMDMFFLHDRGKAFICYGISILLGATSGPTFGGFIIQSQSWTVCFWWTVPLLAISAILVLAFAEETNYDRQGGFPPIRLPESYLANRVATFFPGTAVTPKPSVIDVVRDAAAPFAIGLSPATVLVGLFTMIVFGWHLLNDILSPLFLQTPVEQGGYGFTPIQNSAFSFSIWTGLFAAEGLGFFINDAIPLWVCRRYHAGIWKPELRLYCMWITTILVPIGLGICGAGLQYHLHYMVYALGVWVVGTGALLSVSIAVNYVAESYTYYGTACTLITTLYRLGWGVAIPFFIDPWIARVQIGWVYGMAAFFTLAAGLLILLLLWKGPTLRRWSLMKSLVSSEDGRHVYHSKRSEDS